MCIWDPHEHVLKLRLLGHKSIVGYTAISPCSNYIASLSYDGELRIWNSHTGARLKRFNQKMLTSENILFSACGRYIIGASDDSICLYDIAFATPELITKHLSLSELVFLVKCHLFGSEQVLKDRYYNKLYRSLSDPIKQALQSYWPDLAN